MSSIDEMKKELGVWLVPVQWKSLLESGIEVDILNNNLFDLRVLDLCKGRGGNDPKSFIFSFKVGDEEIAFGVKQRTEIAEKIVNGNVCTNIVPIPLNDHYIEIVDTKNNLLRKYSLVMEEELVPEHLKDKVPDFMDTHVVGNVNIKTYDLENEVLENPFEVEF